MQFAGGLVLNVHCTSTDDHQHAVTYNIDQSAVYRIPAGHRMHWSRYMRQWWVENQFLCVESRLSPSGCRGANRKARRESIISTPEICPTKSFIKKRLRSRRHKTGTKSASSKCKPTEKNNDILPWTNYQEKQLKKWIIREHERRHSQVVCPMSLTIMRNALNSAPSAEQGASWSAAYTRAMRLSRTVLDVLSSLADCQTETGQNITFLL